MKNAESDADVEFAFDALDVDRTEEVTNEVSFPCFQLQIGVLLLPCLRLLRGCFALCGCCHLRNCHLPFLSAEHAGNGVPAVQGPSQPSQDADGHQCNSDGALHAELLHQLQTLCVHCCCALPSSMVA